MSGIEFAAVGMIDGAAVFLITAISAIVFAFAFWRFIDWFVNRP
ncbi:MAG: hypothetical protein WC455_15310 [Dehalococcoidia bacterium]|jgi:hypothetical protein